MRAYSNGPGTRFAFRSILGGVHPLRLDGAGLPANEGTTLPEQLSSAGYRTAGFVNNPFLTEYFGYNRGFDTFLDATYWNDQGERSERLLNRVNDIAKKISGKLPNGAIYKHLKRIYGTTVQQIEKRGGQIGPSDGDVVDAAVDWWDGTGDGRPRFMWIHFMGVHHPYSYYPDQRAALDIDESVEHIRNPTDIVKEGEQPPDAVIDAYDSNVRQTDETVGRLLEEVSDASIVLTADHGEEFGPHGPFHNASTYNSMASVPLLLNVDGVEQGETDELVTHVDIPPIVAALAGTGPAKCWDGKNTLASRRERAYLGFERPSEIQGAVVWETWKYISSWSAPEEFESEWLYDLSVDPGEIDDVSQSQEQLTAEFREQWENHAERVFENRLKSIRFMWDADQSLSEVYDDNDERKTERTIEERLEYLGYK
jgi:arylsulfatase A-like enzyme